MSGPVVGFADGLVHELRSLGYATTTAAELMRLTAHLSRWLQGSGHELAELTPVVHDAFVAERRKGYVNFTSARALDPIVGYLRRIDAVPEPLTVPPTTAAQILLGQFKQFLLDERALSAPVTVAYAHWVRPFVEQPSAHRASTGRAMSAWPHWSPSSPAPCRRCRASQRR